MTRIEPGGDFHAVDAKGNRYHIFEFQEMPEGAAGLYRLLLSDGTPVSRDKTGRLWIEDHFDGKIELTREGR